MSEQQLLPYQIAQIIKQNYAGNCDAAAEGLNMDPEKVKRIFREAGGCVDCGLK